MWRNIISIILLSSLFLKRKKKLRGQSNQRVGSKLLLSLEITERCKERNLMDRSFGFCKIIISCFLRNDRSNGFPLPSTSHAEERGFVAKIGTIDQNHATDVLHWLARWLWQGIIDDSIVEETCSCDRRVNSAMFDARSTWKLRFFRIILLKSGKIKCD